MKIYLTVVVHAKRSHLDNVKAILLNMVRETRKEDGVELYNLHQSVDDETVFTFYEIWKDQTCLNVHNEMAYIKAFTAIAQEQLVEAPKIIKTTLIN